MDQRAKTNRRILAVLAIATLVLGALALWGVSQPKQQEKPLAAAGASTAAMSAAQAKAEVRRLLTELDAFKGLSGFHGAGFSSNGPLTQPERWHNDATDLQKRISGDASLPPTLRAAPGTLIGLALAYRGSKGQETQGTKSDREMITNALK